MVMKPPFLRWMRLLSYPTVRTGGRKIRGWIRMVKVAFSAVRSFSSALDGVIYFYVFRILVEIERM